MERKEKLRKLKNFRRQLPHVSASALSAILKAVKEDGVPDVIDRASMRQARDDVSKTMTPYGPILQTIEVVSTSDVPKQLYIANPFAMLHIALASCAQFRKFFHDRLLETPPSPDAPWHLVLYSDEVTPGNPLSAANKRKFQAIYWSFHEFGPSALAHEESWFCIMTEYSTKVNDLHAGMSQVFGAIIKIFSRC